MSTVPIKCHCGCDFCCDKKELLMHEIMLEQAIDRVLKQAGIEYLLEKERERAEK